ncbi:hypothetical protein GE061_016489 [Apolygus lucorum]|uniref:Uncharacterized protein n=1 Tax=Apolygus lucorum TaxID=248454 RepID=A0A6A4JME7_APOLU|nr:hypothetical protein GE061_016489 [Apolygus lucorum]
MRTLVGRPPACCNILFGNSDLAHIPHLCLSGSVEARPSSSMIAKQLLLLGILGSLAVQIAGSPVSFPTERSESKELDDYAKEDGEARFNHALHREKKKRKRQRLACLSALQQSNGRYKRGAPVEGDERTLLWGGFNYYNTDIHVFNGGYGGQRPSYAPSFAPGQTSNPCQGFPALSGFPSLPGLPSFPTLPPFPNIGNEIIHIVNPGSGSSSSSSSTSSGNRPGSGLGSFGNGGTRPPAPVTTTSEEPPSGGDGDNEDYDYSDGDSDGDSNRIKRRRRPTQNSPLANAIRPASNYIDYYVLRPIDRTFRQIVRWF